MCLSKIYTAVMLLSLTLIFSYPTYSTYSNFDNIPEDGNRDIYGYIVPNERQFYKFNPILRGKKGALIGVGTFRIFQDASQGDFSHVFCLDYSKKVVSFNNALIELFRISTDRIDFLVRMLGNLNARYAFEDYEAGYTHKDLFEQYIWTLLNSNVALNSELKQLINEEDKNEEDKKDREIKFFVKKIMMFYLDGSHSFLRSQFLFQKLKTLALGHRIHTIMGNLSGPTTMRSLAQSLKDQKIPVSIFDISNAFKYIKEMNEEPMFAKNLKAFRYSLDAQILFTNGNLYNYDKGGDSWDYYALDVVTYLRAAKKFAIKNSKDRDPNPYDAYLESIKPLPLDSTLNIDGFGACGKIY